VAEIEDTTMASTPVAYPPSHELALERVMQFIDLVAARPDIDDEDAVAVLIQGGIGGVDAELLIRFVPCALTFALLKLMGLSKFPSTFQVQDAAGRWVEMPLAAEHYFSAALGVGYEVTTHGYSERVNKDTFLTLTSRSAEMNAVNQFFEAGHSAEDLAEGSLGPPTLIGVTVEQIAASRRTV
jgi:hypothetical protein